MQISSTKLSGCFEIFPDVFDDNRGQFVKTYHEDCFIQNNLNITWKEEYYSISKKNVIRGMHFQLPPHDHEKLVYCVSGAVLDVVVDLRNNSPTFKQHIVINLDSQKRNMIYIPKGCAHGFKSLCDNTIMMYKVSTTYNQNFDYGISWDSCNIDWALDGQPILSNRDKSFIKLSDFCSTF